MKIMKIIFIILGIIVLILAVLIVVPCFARTKKKMDLPTVKHLEIEKFMGVWYEIARFPHKFEKDLVGVTATYEMKSNGQISVLNQGYKHTLDGKQKNAKGRARMPNAHEPGFLQVTFFLCFWADYLVLELDENYQYALIGSSTPDYLWILCRQPQMDEHTYNMLVEKAKDFGYDISKLERVKQAI